MTEMAAATPSLTPHIVCDGAAEAIGFYERAFGAKELMRIDTPEGRIMHAAISINGATLMLVDEMKEMGALGPTALGGTPVTLHLNVTDADAAIARAQQAGAIVVMPAADMFWGDRYGQVRDPWGHMWSIAHSLSDRVMSEDELRAAAKDAMCGVPAPAGK